MRPADIELREVQSSNLARIGYDAESQTLVVEFRPRTIQKIGDANARPVRWMYRPVSPALWAEAQRESSLGAFFHTRIKMSAGVQAERMG